MREITERKREIQRLTYLATRDELTGHLNRNSLRAELAEAIERAKREERHCAFLVASIDRLAMINDSYGFDAADEVIVAVGERLSRSLRSSDVIGRTAGNKFGVILKNCTDHEIAIVADRLRAAVRGSVIETRAGQVAATTSVGAVWLPTGAASSQEAMLRAEEALERARRSRPRRLHRVSALAATRRRAPAPDVGGRRGGDRAEGKAPGVRLSAHRRRPYAQDHGIRMPAAHGARGRQHRRRQSVHSRGRTTRAGPPGRPPCAGNGRRHAARAQGRHLERQRFGHDLVRYRLAAILRRLRAGELFHRRPPRGRTDRNRGPQPFRGERAVRVAVARDGLPRGHRRFRRGLHLVPQSADAAPRHGQDRRRLYRGTGELAREPDIRAHAGRSGQELQSEDDGGMGGHGRGGQSCSKASASTISRAIISASRC